MSVRFSRLASRTLLSSALFLLLGASGCEGTTADPDGGAGRGDAGSGVGGRTNGGGSGGRASGADGGSGQGGEGALPGSAGGATSSGGGRPAGGGASETGGNASGDGGSSGEVPDDYLALGRSGSRLEVQVLRAEGAPDRFERFYDTELEMPCQAGKLEDGLWYCLPNAPAGLTFLGFADATCEHGVYTIADECVAPAAVARAVHDCRTTFVAHELEAPAAPGSLYSLSVVTGTETCAPLSGGSFPIEGSLVEGEALTGDDLVQLKLETLPSRGALSVRAVTGADGSRAVDKLVDVASGALCDAPFPPDEGDRCHPTFRAFRDGAFFSNDACTSTFDVAYAPTSEACGETAFIYDAALEAYFEPGPEVTSAVWTLLSGTCYSRESQAWMEYIREVGAPYGGEFGLFEGQLLGEGRLALPVIQEGETPLLPSELAFFDQERGAGCEVQRVDGDLRCLPQAFRLRQINPSLTQYADDACTEELIYCRTGYCEEEVHYDGSVVDSCSGQPSYSNMRVLVSQVTDDVYMKDSEGDCVGPLAPNGVWVAEPVTPEDFGLVERVTL